MAGVGTPAHMDGRSILPLLRKRNNRKIRDQWPDTFLIESSGRREQPEVFAQLRKAAVNSSTIDQNVVELGANLTMLSGDANATLSQSALASHEEGEVDDGEGTMIYHIENYFTLCFFIQLKNYVGVHQNSLNES